MDQHLWGTLNLCCKDWSKLWKQKSATCYQQGLSNKSTSEFRIFYEAHKNRGLSITFSLQLLSFSLPLSSTSRILPVHTLITVQHDQLWQCTGEDEWHHPYMTDLFFSLSRYKGELPFQIRPNYTEKASREVCLNPLHLDSQVKIKKCEFWIYRCTVCNCVAVIITISIFI